MKHHASTPSLRAKRSGAKQSRPSQTPGLLRRVAPRNDQFASRSEAETERIAARFAKTLRGGEVVLLTGNLGAGKTVFVRGLAQGLGVRDRITSPTFVLMRIHRANSRKPIAGSNRDDVRGRQSIGYRLSAIGFLVHVDAYRIRDPRELEAIGLIEWIGRPDAVVAIEWGERVAPLLVRRRIRRITLWSGKARHERRVVFGA